jgi:hypothetical protein
VIITVVAAEIVVPEDQNNQRTGDTTVSSREKRLDGNQYEDPKKVR